MSRPLARTSMEINVGKLLFTPRGSLDIDNGSHGTSTRMIWHMKAHLVSAIC